MPRVVWRMDYRMIFTYCMTHTFQIGVIDPKIFIVRPCDYQEFLIALDNIRYEEVMYDIEYDVETDESIFDPNIPNDYQLIDPANMAEKAELGMLVIVPLIITIIGYKHFKNERRNIWKVVSS